MRHSLALIFMLFLLTLILPVFVVEVESSSTSTHTLYAHAETTIIGNVNYYLFNLSSADGPATILSQSAASTGRKLMGRWVYPLNGIVSISSSTWTVTYRAMRSASATGVIAHCDIDILIRKSDNTVRTTIAANVANSPSITLTNAWETLTGTYDFPGYMVVDQTDYLEVAYYIEVTSPQSSKYVRLLVDDDTLPLTDQTKIENVIFTYPNQPPLASFVYSPAEPHAGETVTFDASASYDPDGSIASYQWDFGDGNVTTVGAPSITHVYENCGNYTVTLTVTDNEGGASSISKAITVINPSLLRLWADAGSYVGLHSDVWIHESWVVSGTVPAGGSLSFNLYIDAISNPYGADPTYDVYLAVAVNDTAQVASITVGPTTITTFTYGEVTWPNVAGGGTLSPHGVYPTWYALAPFGNVSSNHGYYTYPGDPYGPYYAYRAYIPVTITASATMNAGFKVHFDAQGVLVRGSTKPGHRNTNPFSHDLTFEGSLYVPPKADLSITKSGPEYAHVGDEITYTFTVSNNGPDRAVNVVVTDSLLGNIYGPKDLDSGASETFTVKYTVKVTDPDPLTNKATVSSDTLDPNTANNEASWTVDILHPAMKVTKTADKAKAYAGETITYTITVTNTGDCILYNIEVGDTLLGQIWSGTLNVCEIKTFTLTYTVGVGDPDPLRNTVTASGKDILGSLVTDEATAEVDLIAKICGYKFRDNNMNGVWDVGEPPVEGIKIELWLAGSKIKEATTGTDGKYCFDELNAGTYVLKEVLPANWVNTTFSSLSVTIRSGEVSEGNNFGNKEIEPLSVSIDPTTAKIKVGESVAFKSTVSGGVTPYKYQWYLNGTAVSGVTAPTWTFTPTLTGKYIVYLIVTDNASNTAKSNEATVTVAPPLTVSISPTSASILVGQSVTFTSTTSGGYPPYTYQWYLNNQQVSGATTNTWTFKPIAPGIYYVFLKVTDAAGNTAQSDTAKVTVSPVPVGGYSISLTKQTTQMLQTAIYTTVIILFGAITSFIKRKRNRFHFHHNEFTS